MKKKTAPRKSERILLSQKPSTPQTHTHIHIHSTSSSSLSPPSKRTTTMRKKVIAHKSSGRGKNKQPAVEEEEQESHTSPTPSPPPSSPKKTTPGKGSKKDQGFALNDTTEPANLESMEFRDKFRKSHSHFDPSRFNSCTSYEFHKEVVEKRHLCTTYLVSLDNLKNTNIPSLFELLNWKPLLLIKKPVYPGLVREFYANMRLIDGTLHSYVKRVQIALDAETIGAALGFKDEGPRAYMVEKWDTQVGISHKTVLQHICTNLSGLHGTTPTHKALGPVNSLLHRIITHILTPQSGSHNRVTFSDCLILFALVTSTPISFGYIMIRHMWDSVKSTRKANLPYGMFLTGIFEYFKVDLLNEKVENDVSTIRGGGMTKETKGRKSDSEHEGTPESSKTIRSFQQILGEFSNMADMMFRSHKESRKQAYENEKAWKNCKERVNLMLEHLNKDLGEESEGGAEEEDMQFSDD
ncbi:uncharacterized protein LOC130963595 [Arachis stenosperma]|uniref:uncharacterized protein LOC130963595 n=1 Tax=Arachis stenosperma TaxID=217475 RepID=UPI0025AC7EC4|nr:uncharacterized protein LOC130963595 [Arachis stenosperma]